MCAGTPKGSSMDWKRSRSRSWSRSSHRLRTSVLSSRRGRRPDQEGVGPDVQSLFRADQSRGAGASSSPDSTKKICWMALGRWQQQRFFKLDDVLNPLGIEDVERIPLSAYSVVVDLARLGNSHIAAFVRVFVSVVFHI